MQRISIALSALISRKQYRLQAASKVTKTERQITKLCRSEFQTVGPATEKANMVVRISVRKISENVSLVLLLFLADHTA